MLNQNKTGLSIFDNFIVDYSLPKYQKPKDENKKLQGAAFGNSDLDGMADGGDWVFAAPPQINFSPDATITIGKAVVDSDGATNKKPSLFKRIISRCKRKKKEVVPPPPPPPKFTIEGFFTSIKNSKEEVEKITERLESYKKLLLHAKDCGQTAMFESLEKQLYVVRSETQLYGTGFKTCISEQQVVDFYKDSEKGIRLDWVKNYTRVIPEKVKDIKVKLDALFIFDNYVIMHYDPDTKSFAETEKEIAERKRKAGDPILFGVLKSSRRLYFVSDWVDEHCDLTLEQFIKKFGDDAVKANDITATIHNK